MTNDFHPLYYAWEHKLPILAALMTVVTAGVKTAPVPGKPFSLYEWVYDWLHQIFNITNTRLTPAPVVTAPDTSGVAASVPAATIPAASDTPPRLTGIQRMQSEVAPNA